MSLDYSYDNTALYDHIFDHMRPDFPYIWAVLEVVKPKKIVEHGAGSGRLLPLFLNSTADTIVGLDIEKNMVESFKRKGGDKVESYVADITKPNNNLSDASIVVLTSSLMKHIEPSIRKVAWSSLYHSIGNDTLLYIDHSQHIYGVATTTSWKSYYDTLRYWWPEEYRRNLKKLFWRKDVVNEMDVLYYKNGTNGEVAMIETFSYSIDSLLSDLSDCGFITSCISSSFTQAVHIEENNRFIGFASKSSSSQLTEISKKIAELANGRCTL